MQTGGETKICDFEVNKLLLTSLCSCVIPGPAHRGRSCYSDDESPRGWFSLQLTAGRSELINVKLYKALVLALLSLIQ